MSGSMTFTEYCMSYGHTTQVMHCLACTTPSSRVPIGARCAHAMKPMDGVCSSADCLACTRPASQLWVPMHGLRTPCHGAHGRTLDSMDGLPGLHTACIPAVPMVHGLPHFKIITDVATVTAAETKATPRKLPRTPVAWPPKPGPESCQNHAQKATKIPCRLACKELLA